MNNLRQIFSITAMNLSAMRNRIGASLVIVAGMAAVVAVSLSVLSLSSGLAQMLANSFEPDRVVVTSHDARFEGASNLARAAVLVILDAPGIKRDAGGKPVATADAVTFVPSIKKSDGLDGFVGLRGVGANFFTLHSEVRLTEGQMFKPALHEIIVGRGVHDQFEGYSVGDTVALQDGDWKVVGIFDTDGINAAWALADSETMLSAFRRNSYNSVTAEIDPGKTAFDDFKAALTTNPQLTVDVEREPDFFGRQFDNFNSLLSAIAYWVGAVMGLGAMFGALNTMYAAVASRTLEIATLRAIGFGPAPVVASILAESLLLAFVGAVIGSACALAAFNGNHHMMGNLVFNLFISPKMLAGGMILALAVGFVGAVFPAIRAARLPVAQALQVR